MPQRDHLTALDLDIPERSELPEEMQGLFNYCEEEYGFVPNVLQAYSHNIEQLAPFASLYNAMMRGESGLSALEKEIEYVPGCGGTA